MGNISTNGTVTGKKFIGPVTGKDWTDINSTDYVVKGIACCLAAQNTVGSPNSWSSGKLVLHRVNGIYQTPTIEYTMHQRYDKYHGVYVNYQTTGTNFRMIEPTVFCYGGTYYGGFIYIISDATDYFLGVDTVGNFEPFHIGAIYKWNTTEVYNSEVYNSLQPSAVAQSNIFNTKGTLFTDTLVANGSSMVGTSLPTAQAPNQIFFKIV